MSILKIKKNVIDKKGYKCETCGISEWQTQAICLELDHIDGNNKNNEIPNLRLLCPNCHSQTLTFRGKNINGFLKITDEELIKALEETNNIRQALLKVGLTPKGANYKRASILLNFNYTKPLDTKNSQYGTIWINNGMRNKKIKKELLNEYTTVGWVRGRLLDNAPPSGKGRTWITNGLQNKFVKDVVLPNGWWKGKA